MELLNCTFCFPREKRYMNGGSIALFNTDAMKWKTTAMSMLYGRTSKVWLLFLDVDLLRPTDAC